MYEQRHPYPYFSTPSQQLYFNAPVQIGPVSHLSDESLLQAHPELWTETFQIPVIPGGLILQLRCVFFPLFFS